MPFYHPLAFDHASLPGNPHATIEGARARSITVYAKVKLASYIIDLSNPFDEARYRAEMEVCRHVYPNAAILLVGLQTGNSQTNIPELQSFAGVGPSFIIANSGSVDQKHEVIGVRAVAILFDQLRAAIQPYGDTPLGLALQDLVERARQESPRTALVLASETLNLIRGLQQRDDSIKLQAVANFYETTKDNINYSLIYQSDTHRSLLSACLTVLCRALIGVLIGAVCGFVCAGVGFLIAGPVGGTVVGLIAGVALSIWLVDLSTKSFNSTPHFTGSFSFFKTSIGKSVDKVVSMARQDSQSPEMSVTDVPEDTANLLPSAAIA